MTTPESAKPTKSINPLYGLKLEQLLTDISEQYGWECLSETLNIERFQFHTGMKSTMKWLRNHEWAKDKVEDFYLYVYKNYAWPDDKQLMIPPRDRSSLGEPESDCPAEITELTNFKIENASDMRGVKRNSTAQNKAKDEPAYDPNNPWNK